MRVVATVGAAARVNERGDFVTPQQINESVNRRVAVANAVQCRSHTKRRLIRGCGDTDDVFGKRPLFPSSFGEEKDRRADDVGRDDDAADLSCKRGVTLYLNDR